MPDMKFDRAAGADLQTFFQSRGYAVWKKWVEDLRSEALECLLSGGKEKHDLYIGHLRALDQVLMSKDVFTAKVIQAQKQGELNEWD